MHLRADLGVHAVSKDQPTLDTRLAGGGRIVALTRVYSVG
jgi:hypothetical protein